MIEIRSKLRRWGNSFGIVVPQSALNGEIKENDEIIVLITTQNLSLENVFGILKNKKLDAQKIKDEIREEETKDELFS